MVVTGTIDLEFHIAADLAAPAAARRCIENLSDWTDAELLDDIKFLVNELVTNSLQHASAPGDRIDLRLAGDPGCVRVEVSDAGPGFVPLPSPAELDDTSGRGLFLVDRMSDNWGVIRDERTHVWFEIDPSQRPATG
jgi:anti-sigma regulatory factor (Ser/Thr protein kinase)